MVSMHLSIRECDGQVVVALRGKLDVVDAASVVAAFAAVTAIDVASVQASVDETADSAGRSRKAAAPAAERPILAVT